MLFQELRRVIVELIGLVAVGCSCGGGVVEMDRRFAGECPGLYAAVNEVRAPGRGVAGHEEADGHGGVRLRDVRALRGLGQVVGFVLGAEVGEHGDGAGLVVLGAEGGDEDVGG